MKLASAVLFVAAVVAAAAVVFSAADVLSVANAQEVRATWVPAAAEVKIFTSTDCESNNVYTGNITSFNQCLYFSSSRSFQFSYDEHFTPDTFNVVYAPYSSSCGSTRYSGSIPLNGTCALLSGSYSAIVTKVYWSLTPRTAHTQCLSELFRIDDDFNDQMYRMTQDNYTNVDKNGNAMQLESRTTWWTAKSNSVCADSDNSTNVFARLYVRGSLRYEGISYPKEQRAMFTASYMELEINEGTSDKYLSDQLIDVLNKQCPCSSKWGYGTNAVYESKCKSPFPDNYWLCWLVSGGRIRLLSNTISEGITGAYRRSIFNDSVIHPYSQTKVELDAYPDFDNSNEDDCEIDLWNSCSYSVKRASQACAYNTANPWNDLCVMQIMGSRQEKCCPCAVRYARQYNVPWLGYRCYPHSF